MKTLNHFIAVVMLTAAPTNLVIAQTASGLQYESFATAFENHAIQLYTLTNSKGMEACITNYGARLVSLMVPNRDGKLQDVVLGYDSISNYLRDWGGCYGATVGRFANRIADAEFTLDGIEYKLQAFRRPGQTGRSILLHSGASGFHNHVWDALQIDKQTLVLTYTSPDGDGGFPGKLTMKLTYQLTDDNALHLTYDGTTDKPTVVNMTNHSYFNLERLGTTAANHLIQVNASHYTPNDKELLPTGEIASIVGTPLDLRKLQPVGERRFDNNFVLNTKGRLRQEAARLESPQSGIRMLVFTTEPGIQIYSGMGRARIAGKHGVRYPAQGAICLETQHYPDSPNKPNFPSTAVRPDKPYHSVTIYKFERQ